MLQKELDQKEYDRINALKSYNILDSLQEDEFDRITQLASVICEVPISLISLIDENRQWFKSKVGLDINETARDISFCQYAIMGTTFFEIEDAGTDRRFKENPLVLGYPNIRFYGSIPLIDPSGKALGSLCVIDRVPNKLSDTQQEALSLLAQEVTAKIVARKEKREAYQSLLFYNFSDSILFTVDKYHKFIKFNPSFLRKLGWTEKELKGTQVLDIIHPDDRESMLHEMLKLKMDHDVTLSFQNRVRRKSGSYAAVDWSANTDDYTGYMFATGQIASE